MKKICLVLVILIPILLVSVTRTVSLDGTQQYTSIQTAVNACLTGDIVLVYPGRYVENINLNGHNITLASLYSQSPLQTYIDNTIIDGNLSTCIKIITGETVTINGFTLVNNEQHQNPYTAVIGGGLYISNSSHVYLLNCIIRDCLAKWGGGIWASYNPTIEFSNVIIHSNQSLNTGGGLTLTSGGQLIWNTLQPSRIYNNVAPIGMDVLIRSCQNQVNISLELGSKAISEPDSFFVLCYNNTPQPTVDITQSYFTFNDIDLFVSPDGNDNNDGLTSITPFKTIKHALQVINSNQESPRTVHLAAGTYSSSTSGQLLPLSFKPNVRIIGAGTGQTIIDGEFSRAFFAGWFNHDIYLSDMSFNHGRASSTNPLDIMDSYNVTLSNLSFHDNQCYLTSGIYLLRTNNIICENLDIGETNLTDFLNTIDISRCTDVYINNVISHDNVISGIDYYWLGFSFDESDIVLRNTIIANNSSPDAYVLHYQNIYPESADYNLDMSNVLFYNNHITENSWSFAPVYLQNRYQRIKVNNCTFANNSGSGTFCKVFCYADFTNLISYNPGHYSELAFTNHVFNSLTNQYIDADVTVRNSLFRTSSIYAQLPELATFTDNIFNGNPLFLGSVTDTLEVSQPEYYYLSPNSPCINMGTADTTGLNLPAMDLAGNYRVWNNRIDMGCYEYGSEPYTANDNPEYPPLPSKIMLSTYPNPVYLNGSKSGYTFIEFTLPEKAKEQPVIDIYNLKGQKVRTIRLSQSYNDLVRKAGLHSISQSFAGGNLELKQETISQTPKDLDSSLRWNDRKGGEFYSTVWDCKDDRNQRLASGIYIVKVRSGSKQAAIKMTLLK